MMTLASMQEKDFKVTKTVALLPFLPKNSAQRSASEALLPVLPLTRDYLYNLWLVITCIAFDSWLPE